MRRLRADPLAPSGLRVSVLPDGQNTRRAVNPRAMRRASDIERHARAVGTSSFGVGWCREGEFTHVWDE